MARRRSSKTRSGTESFEPARVHGCEPQTSRPSDEDQADATSSDATTASSLSRSELAYGTHDRGYLPHWKSAGATYFVTFRLAGTLPQRVLDQIKLERRQLAARAAASQREMTRLEAERLRELHSKRVEAYLDAGHGNCWLRRRDIAELIVGAITHFADDRYALHAWTVMPNHVHVVVSPLGTHTLTAVLHSWKGFTGSKANERLGRRGMPFWQRESYDHLVRNEREFHRLCEYTVANPVTAGLCERPEDWPHGSAAATLDNEV